MRHTAVDREGTLLFINNGEDDFVYFLNMMDFVVNNRYSDPSDNWAIIGDALTEKEKRFIQFIQNLNEVVDGEDVIAIIDDFKFNVAGKRDWTKNSFTIIEKRQPRNTYELEMHLREKEILKKEFKDLVLFN